MLRAPLLLVPLLLASAGCLGAADLAAPPEGDDAAATLAPLDLPWGLASCAAAVAFFDVPADRIRPHLPEGFQPALLVNGLTGVAANPTGEATFGMEMFTCASGEGLNGTVEELAYGSYFAVVEPPAALRDPEVDVHFAKWDVLVPDAPRRALLAAHGVPALDGSATFETFDQQGPVASVTGTLVLGNATHAFSGSTRAPGPDAMSFVEFTPVPGGLVAWKTAAVLTAMGLGQGQVVVADGTLAAEVLGAGPHDAVLMVFQGDFRDGTVRTVEPDA